MKRIVFPSILLSLACLAGCGSPVPVTGTAKSTQQLADEARAAAIKASFNPADLSGCWQERQFKPIQGDPGPGFLLRKTGDNSYEASAASRMGKIKLTGSQVERTDSDGTVRQGKTSFDTPPTYQIIFDPLKATDGLAALEQNQMAWEWAGKTCGS